LFNQPTPDVCRWVGLRELRGLRPNRVLMIRGTVDLAIVVEVFLARAGRAPGVAIVPDRRRVGTNLLLCAPPHAIAPCFGGHSFERHLAAAATAGVEARVLHIEELTLDLDEPDDLDYLRSRDSGERATPQRYKAMEPKQMFAMRGVWAAVAGVKR
jgi:2-phospho-L-lactate guanylyltransferase (CobY/MobA/RfbA family)